MELLKNIAHIFRTIWAHKILPYAHERLDLPNIALLDPTWRPQIEHTLQELKTHIPNATLIDLAQCP